MLLLLLVGVVVLDGVLLMLVAVADVDASGVLLM